MGDRHRNQGVPRGTRPARPKVAEPAAEAYLRGGEIPSALQVLLRAGLAERAAALVTGLAPDRLASLEHSELGALIDVLPADAIAEHPRVLIHFAGRANRRLRPTRGPMRWSAPGRSRARRRGPSTGDRRGGCPRPRQRGTGGGGQELSCPRSRAMLGGGDRDSGSRPRRTRTGGGAARRREEPQEAESLLERSLVLCRALGQAGWAGQTTMTLVDRVHFARGQYDLAMRRIDELLLELPRRSRDRAIALVQGSDRDRPRHFPEAEATLAEARRMIDLTGDQRAAAFVAWDTARLSSQRGDPTPTIAALHEVEVHRADWFEQPAGTEFLAEAADLLDRVGESDAASQYLKRARERETGSPSGLGIAEAAILARSGDPATARVALVAVRALPGTQRRETWRLTLLEVRRTPGRRSGCRRACRESVRRGGCPRASPSAGTRASGRGPAAAARGKHRLGERVADAV